MKKKYLLFVILILFSVSIFSLGIGSNLAFPKIKEVLEDIDIPQNKIYTCSDEDIERLISTAAEVQINVFELIDCVYRYLSKNKMRVEIKGSSLQDLMENFDFGKTRVLAILPIPLIEKIYLGENFSAEQKALQIYLTEKYENYIEIGTALYEKEFGFEILEPNLFLNSYGMKVKKFGIKMRIKKIHLYEPGLGAIYALGFFKPKRWNLWLISKIEKQD